MIERGDASEASAEPVTSPPSLEGRVGAESVTTAEPAEHDGFGTMGSTRTGLRSRRALRRGRSSEVHRALLLTALSALLPGLGLTMTRKRRLGALLVGLSLLVIGILLWMALRGGLMQGATRFASTRGIVFLLLVCALGGVVWLAGIVLTYAETSVRRWPSQTKWLHRIFTAALCLIIGIPAAVATNDVWVTKDTLHSVFKPRYKGRDVVPHAPKAGADPWAGVPRVNLLFLGSDAGADRTGVRTDSILVASVNTKTGDTTLISIPRNLERVPIPATNPLHKIYPHGFYCPSRGTGHDCLMDALWTEAGTNYPQLFPKDEPNPGLDTTREVVGAIVGMPIDYTVVVDLAGFQKLVDAMGGVYVNVPAGGIAIGGRIANGHIIPGSITGRIPGGYHKLNGYQALWYSRSRVENSDDDRMRRQRCMMNTLISQADPISLITKFTTVMAVAKQSITMDVPQDRLGAFATLVDRMKHGNSRSVNLTYPTIASGNPDFAKIKRLVATAIATPHSTTAPAPGSGTKGAAPHPASPASSAPTGISNTANSC